MPNAIYVKRKAGTVSSRLRVDVKNLLEVSGGCFVPLFLGFKDELADFAHGAAAAGLSGNMVSDRFDLFHAVGDRYGESYLLQDRNVYKVITYETDLFSGYLESF